MKDYIGQLSQRDDISVIYNGVSENLLKLIPHKISRSESQILIFTYAGNIGHAQGLSFLVNAFSKFLKSQSDGKSILQIIGNGPEKSNVIKIVNDLGIKKSVIFIDEVSKIEVANILLNSNVLLIPIIPSDIFNLTIPSKVFDYLSFGRPIIASVQGEGKEILSRSKSNIITPMDQTDTFANAFAEMYTNYKFYNEESYLNKIIASEFSRAKSTDIFYDISFEVLK